jgi:CheY-like chemotaxis protein
MVEDTANLLSQNAAPSVELTCLIAPNFPSSVLGDPTRVRQIVSNLVSNALKFTRFGRVDLRLACIVGGVRLEVSDTGIGIPEEAQARIFQPFTQAGAGITRQYGGTGLGLALTRNLCKAMQGHLHIQSQTGFGSRFCAELPLPAHTEAIPPVPLAGRVVALTNVGSGLAELLQGLLPRWGLDYARVDAADALAGAPADLLITDELDHVLALRPTLRTPILLVTAYGSFLPGEQATQLAPLHQLARPLARNALYQTLRRTLHGEPNAPLPHERVVAQERRARVLLVEDNPVNQLVAKGMLGKLGCQVQVAADGTEALERLEQGAFDLVLMDCNMPIMDGYEATRRIRQDGRWPALPIVALTANAMPEERERCRAAGMNDYLAKPFRREELLALIDHWVPVNA